MRLGRWQGSRATPAREAEGACGGLGKSAPARSSPVYGEIGSPLGKVQFSYSVCSQIGVLPRAKLVAQNNGKQTLFQHPAVIWGSRWGHQLSGCLLRRTTPLQRIRIPEPPSSASSLVISCAVRICLTPAEQAGALFCYL